MGGAWAGPHERTPHPEQRAARSPCGEPASASDRRSHATESRPTGAASRRSNLRTHGTTSRAVPVSRQPRAGGSKPPVRPADESGQRGAASRGDRLEVSRHGPLLQRAKHQRCPRITKGCPESSISPRRPTRSRRTRKTTTAGKLTSTQPASAAMPSKARKTANQYVGK